MGVPVVVTAVGGPAEIVRDGIDGRVLEPRDPGAWAVAVNELLAQPELRAKMGRSGRERAAELFAPDAGANAVTTIYRDVAARYGNGQPG